MAKLYRVESVYLGSEIWDARVTEMGFAASLLWRLRALFGMRQPYAVFRREAPPPQT